MSEKKHLSYYMRILHRDVGFLVVGLIMVYALSGIVLVYRDTDFLKTETNVERQVKPGLETPEQLGRALHMRHLEVLKTEGSILYFKGGTYDQATGKAEYRVKRLPSFLNHMIGLHKTTSQSFTKIPAIVFAVLLLFLAVSSFWMFKPHSPLFRRGLLLTGIGILIALVLVFVL